MDENRNPFPEQQAFPEGAVEDPWANQQSSVNWGRRSAFGSGPKPSAAAEPARPAPQPPAAAPAFVPEPPAMEPVPGPFPERGAASFFSDGAQKASPFAARPAQTAPVTGFPVSMPTANPFQRAAASPWGDPPKAAAKPAPAVPAGGVLCERCGAANPLGARSCCMCGAQLRAGLRRCEGCQAQIDLMGAAFCPFCGRPL